MTLAPGTTLPNWSVTVATSAGERGVDRHFAANRKSPHAGGGAGRVRSRMKLARRMPTPDRCCHRVGSGDGVGGEGSLDLAAVRRADIVALLLLNVPLSPLPGAVNVTLHARHHIAELVRHRRHQRVCRTPY